MVEAVMVAMDQHAALSYAQDAGWGVLSRTQLTFRTQGGNDVPYVPDAADGVRGMADGTRIYLAAGWNRRQDAEHIRDLLRMGRIVRAEARGVAPATDGPIAFGYDA